ncbi:MAG: hypothetical protein AAF352_08115, partial [Pseudomonadota bacterium]
MIFPSHSTQRRDAIIDVGSNSIRMVVYVQHNNRRYYLFNESMKCRLGSGLADDGVILPRNIDLAEKALARLMAIARHMDLTAIKAVGTAALRDAQNGALVGEHLSQVAGLPIEIISQRREAELVAEGMLSTNPHYEGFLADLGGASIELVAIHKKTIISPISLPFGILRTSDTEAHFAQAVQKYARDPHNCKIPEILCVTGGNWRYLAKVMMGFANHPVPLIEGYSLQKSQAIAYLDQIITIADINDLPEPDARRKNAIIAARFLKELLEFLPVKNLVFSASSIREGLYAQVITQQDAFCPNEVSNLNRSRWPGYEEELWRWLIESNLPLPSPRITDVFVNQADNFWHYHPDLRANVAYMNSLYSPIAELNH